MNCDMINSGSLTNLPWERQKVGSLVKEQSIVCSGQDGAFIRVEIGVPLGTGFGLAIPANGRAASVRPDKRKLAP